MDAFELHAVLADGTFQFVEIGTGCAGNAYTDDNISTSSSSNASSDDDEDVELIMPICASRIGKFRLLCQSVSACVYTLYVTILKRF